MQIRDDGRGGATLTGGTLLLGLKDRAEALGGRSLLDSPPDAGTTLRLELPLIEAEHRFNHDNGITSSRHK
jgi:signal transduction histidine kinase